MAFALGITAAGLLACSAAKSDQKPASDTAVAASPAAATSEAVGGPRVKPAAVEGSEVVIKEFASFDDAKALRGR